MVGFLASIAAMILGWIPEGKFDINHGLLLCASSVLTAAIASFVLGKFVFGIFRSCHIYCYCGFIIHLHHNIYRSFYEMKML